MATSPDPCVLGALSAGPQKHDASSLCKLKHSGSPTKKVEKTGSNRFYLVQYMQIIISICHQYKNYRLHSF